MLRQLNGAMECRATILGTSERRRLNVVLLEQALAQFLSHIAPADGQGK